MAGPPSSVTRTGKNEPWDLQVSRGQIPWHKILFKFGNNADINGSLETIWTQGGLYVYPSAATIMKVSSTSTSDTALGTGARTVLVAGLDASYNEISEVVVLDGQNPVNTTNSFLRVFRSFVVTAGSSNTAAGTIYIGVGVVTAGVPATVYAQIALGENQTQMALWTVPAGYTAFLSTFTFTAAGSNSTHSILGKLLVRPYGGVLRNSADVSANAGLIQYNWDYPLRITEKSDIECQAIALSGGNFYTTASFELIYIKNDAGTA